MRQVTSAIEAAPGGAVLQGDLGIGKTRLARVVADALAGGGWHVERCIGSPAITAIPFGAVSQLASMPSSRDPALNLEQIRREIVRRAASSRLLLVIDDGNLVDAESMLLFQRMAALGDAAVLMTVRTGEAGNFEAITSLWKDGHAQLIGVGGLDRQAHDELVRHVVGPAEAAAHAERLWELTQGNPLFLRELLSMAAGSDLPGTVEPVASRPGFANRWTRLAAIIDAKALRLSRKEREALDLVAVAEPVRLEVLRRLVGKEVLAGLESHGMAVVDDLGGEEHMWTAHPVYGATVRATLPGLRKRLLLTKLANALIESGLERAGDAMRAANWLLDAEEELPPRLAVQAATEALAKGDAVLAERLSRSALQHEPGSVARIALGSALSLQHRLAEARQVFEEALADARNESERAQAALAFARHIAWMELDFAGGTALLEEVLPALGDRAERLEVRAEQAIIAALSGDAVTAERVAADVLADPEADERVVLSALIQSTLARCMLGRFEGLEAALDEGDALAARLRAEGRLALDQLGITRAMWLRFVDLNRALDITQSGHERAQREGGVLGVWSLTHAWVLMDAGDLESALTTARRGLTELQRFDPFHNLPMLHALVATTHGLRGESHAARESLARAGPPQQMEPRSRIWADRAAIWIHAGDPGEASTLAIQAGERAEAGTMITWASPLYHDAVRLGHAEMAVENLERLAAKTTVPLIAAMAEHARAATGDVDALLRIAAEYETRGAVLHAAEALSQAAGFSTGVLQARLTLRALRLARRCPDVATPLIARLAWPLSARESEIAELAAEGATSREIAKRLVLSTRTVDNHLASVYRKLGLAGREELPAIFDGDDRRPA